MKRATPECPRASRELRLQPAPPLTGEHLDHAADRIGAVEHAGRPTDHLDPVDIVDGQVRVVEFATRVVHRHAIDQDAGVAALTAAGVDRRPGSR